MVSKNFESSASIPDDLPRAPPGPVGEGAVAPDGEGDHVVLGAAGAPRAAASRRKTMIFGKPSSPQKQL